MCVLNRPLWSLTEIEAFLDDFIQDIWQVDTRIMAARSGDVLSQPMRVQKILKLGQGEHVNGSIVTFSVRSEDIESRSQGGNFEILFQSHLFRRAICVQLI